MSPAAGPIFPLILFWDTVAAQARSRPPARLEPGAPGILARFGQSIASLRSIVSLGIKDQFGTANLRAFLRGLISAATENDETLNRHLKLFRFARATILTVVAMILLGSSIFGAGVAAAVALAGMHVAVAISIGAGGSASFILTIVVRSRSYLKAIFGALSEIESADSKSDA
jgi:hypothetical protein